MFVVVPPTNINIQQIENIKYSINVISSFVEEKLIPDVYRISEVYNDYFKIGKGHGNLMCYELYNDYSPPIKYCAPGVIINGVKETFDINNITESVAKTWANGTSETIIPGLDEPAKPNAYKENAYSWINAPRYNGHAMEVGALARMTLNGGYSGGISTMDRIAAKSLEAKRICETIKVLIEMLKLGKAYQKEWEMPEKAKGIGLIEAERGALGHWLSIDKKLVSNYTLIPPSAWNLSPEDSKGIKGTAEQALIGTQINDIKYPVEIGRIVRSFDPCLNCAAHIVSDRYEPFNINIV